MFRTLSDQPPHPPSTYHTGTLMFRLASPIKKAYNPPPSTQIGMLPDTTTPHQIGSASLAALASTSSTTLSTTPTNDGETSSSSSATAGAVSYL